MKAFFFFFFFWCIIFNSSSALEEVQENLRGRAEDAEITLFIGSLLGTGCSKSRCQQETRIRQAGSQGLPGLHAGGLGAGLAEPGNATVPKRPLCLLPKPIAGEGGTGQDTGAMAIHVCVCVGLTPSKDCSFFL